MTGAWTSETLAALHRACFTDAPRPWSASEFDELVARPDTHLIENEAGFAVIRIAADEAEVLTIAVQPGQQRRGHATTLLANAARIARENGATRMLLEVAESNAAGRALYVKSGYTEAGRRKDYYNPRGNLRVSALVLVKSLIEV